MQKVNLSLVNLLAFPALSTRHPVFLACYEIDFGTEVGDYIKNRFQGISSKFPNDSMCYHKHKDVPLQTMIDDVVDNEDEDFLPNHLCVALPLKKLVQIQDLDCPDDLKIKNKDLWILSDCVLDMDYEAKASCTVDISLLSDANLKMLRLYKDYTRFYKAEV